MGAARQARQTDGKDMRYERMQDIVRLAIRLQGVVKRADWTPIGVVRF